MGAAGMADCVVCVSPRGLNGQVFYFFLAHFWLFLFTCSAVNTHAARLHLSPFVLASGSKPSGAAGRAPGDEMFISGGWRRRRC